MGTGYGGKLEVRDCKFTNFFFPYGLFSNTNYKWNRNLPYFSFMGPQDCRDVNSALTAPCYLLTIEESTFSISAKGYSYMGQYGKPTTLIHDSQKLDQYSDNLEHEGIVLFLQSFPGHVTISKNSFS